MTSTTPQRQARQHRYLMCQPEHYTVDYRINPWMDPSVPTDTPLALRQWEQLRQTYLDLGHEVALIDPLRGLPDMVYAANGGFTFDGQAYTARFAHIERAPEGPAYATWFEQQGYTVHEAREVNEGEGDFLLVGERILAGTGFRTSVESHTELARLSEREVLTLELIDPRFYHLDTALTVLDEVAGEIAYLPAAFSPASQAHLARLYPEAIHVGEADGLWLGLNAASDGRNVVLPAQATTYQRELTARGYTPVPIDLHELLLAGGSVKCCTLELRTT